MSFTGKVIIVTGASSGIGADAAKHLAALGGKVCLVGRNEEHLKNVAKDIKASGSLVHPLIIVADVTKDAERIIGDAVKHFGQLDVLVNNAGIFRNDSVNDFGISLFDEVLNTNLAIITSLAVPHLEKTKGNIVNIASVLGMEAFAGTLSYSVSKAALNQYTKCIAIDLAAKGIRVNAINPAVIRTPLFENSGISAEEAENVIDAYKPRHLIGRIGKPLDTSEAIAYLASDSASFVTGILLPVDGGFLLN